MTKEEMMKQMQNLLGLQKQVRPKDDSIGENTKAVVKETIDIAEIADSVDELAEMFCDSAIILSRISNVLEGKKNPWHMDQNEADDCDEDDITHMDGFVLYADPGLPPRLMPVEDAMRLFPGFEDEQAYYCFEICKGLILHYMDYDWENEDEINICTPVYIAAVDVKKQETVDLSAMGFINAMEFLADHRVTITDKNDRIYQGYWLPKKAK